MSSDSDVESFSLFRSRAQISNIQSNLKPTSNENKDSDRNKAKRKRNKKADNYVLEGNAEESAQKDKKQKKRKKKELDILDTSLEKGTISITQMDEVNSDSDSDTGSDLEENISHIEKRKMSPNIKSLKNKLDAPIISGKTSASFDESESEAIDAGSYDEDDGNDVDGEYAALKAELSTMSFEELLKVKEKIGLKVFNQVMYGSNMKRKSAETSGPKNKFKRENKNRPMEISSKKPVPRVRKNMTVKKKVSRDPRFDDLSGEYNEDFFKQSYYFLEDIKVKEKEKVKKQLKKEKDEEKKKNIQTLLNRMNQQEKSASQKKKRTELLNEWKRKEKEMVKEGKVPYFLKKSEKKKLELAEKYKELKKSGKVEKYLNKKRKRNAQKERKKLPARLER